ncbi:MAG: hypothetical protein WCR06_07705 [bacterium]
MSNATPRTKNQERAAIRTCGNCGHHVVLHGCLHRHCCAVTGAKTVYPEMSACERWAHRPEARVRVEKNTGAKAREGGAA